MMPVDVELYVPTKTIIVVPVSIDFSYGTSEDIYRDIFLKHILSILTMPVREANCVR